MVDDKPGGIIPDIWNHADHKYISLGTFNLRPAERDVGFPQDFVLDVLNDLIRRRDPAAIDRVIVAVNFALVGIAVKKQQR